MGDITRNLIEDEALTLDENGGSVTVSYILEDVPGEPGAVLWNAVLDSRIPRYGEYHPYVPGIRVTNIAASSMDPAMAKVVVTYSRPAANQDTPYEPEAGPAADPEGRGTISTSSTIQQIDTQFAVDGLPLLVLYSGRVVDEEGNEQVVENDPQVATYSVGRPLFVITFTRKETASPMLLGAKYVGSVNRTRVGPFPSISLLCTRIDTTTEDDGLTFNVSYEFQFNPSTWYAVVSYIEKDTGAPPPDVKTPRFAASIDDSIGGESLDAIGNGTAVYEVYPAREFGELNLPWITGGKRRL